MPSKRGTRLILLTACALLVLFCIDPFRHAHTKPHFVASTVNWATVREYHPAGRIKQLPRGKPRPIAPVQAPASAFESPTRADPRRDEVLKVFKRSYRAYKEHAWMRDELAPLSGRGKDTFGGWAATLVDSLDTLWIMNLKTEFYEASAALAQIDWAKTPDGAANLFETTIRHLGGLLAAYDLSGEDALLRKAVELGEMLYKGFDTPNRLPGFWLNYEEARNGKQVAGVNDPSASPASLCLEFTRLSQITGDWKYYDATDRVIRFLQRVQYDSRLPGMWPRTINFRQEKVTESRFTLGALADSLYEYLPKMHALTGGLDDTYEKLYYGASETAIKHLLFRPMLPGGDDILFTGDVKVSSTGDIDKIPEGQHLSCFAGGMFGLGGKLFDKPDHVDVGDRLARGCGWAYGQFPTGVMPEIFNLLACESISGCAWDEDRWLRNGDTALNRGWVNARDARYLLRPEAIESIFLLYRMTASEDLRDIAWDMFQGIVRSTKTDIAHAAIRKVTEMGSPQKEDSMESFWLAETLKYFYLIFSPIDLVSLDEYVLNTEAHPFRRPE
ncbi:mannosyl-oligosaccharide alpha-1,2-mannosidase [Geosmithia morbida]|uniref:alpha-1,2-Mannosidase n=1 Tax=Geosmithia morbida TaxID=1094350 RepID=A0A9P4YTL8_9HYPO|nr:mannosyl-oligosaccharide alpha-1,2-mannosidase [Geosmithia morbida]KAF4121436.1 mannosyl-oligosaccharide alpha-1,2-mannosidase [Geosmithia morbida]